MQAQVWWVLMVPGISSLPEQNGTEKKKMESKFEQNRVRVVIGCF